MANLEFLWKKLRSLFCPALGHNLISWFAEDEEESNSPAPQAACLESREFQTGDLVWGPLQGYPSWPGKVLQDGEQEGVVLVCWYGGRQITQVPTVLTSSVVDPDPAGSVWGYFCHKGFFFS